MEQVSKQSVGYRRATGVHRCGNCVMFHDGKCDLVKGVIEPGDVCDRWEGEVNKTEDLELVAIQLDKMQGQLNWMTIKMDELLLVDPNAANAYAATCWQIRTQSFGMLVKLFDAEMDVSPHEFGWSVEQLVSSEMRKWLIEDYCEDVGKSEETPYLSSHHAPIGHEGLWHTPNKKHPQKEQLPAYVQNVRNALMRAGHGEQEAHAMAIGAIKRWASGKGAWGHKGKVTPVVQQAAQRALDEWNKLKEEHSG